MSLTKGKHNIVEIENIRCSVVETGLTTGRADFLKGLLLENGYDVRMEHEKSKDGTSLDTIVLGVTDILFNAAIQVYGLRLKRADHKVVTLQYWNQWPTDPDLPYYLVIR